MTNGIGTWFCKAHFDAGWGWDDAIECAMFVFFPVWPHRAVHLREEPGGSFQPGTYQAIPLRYSERLVRHVLVRRWLAGAVGLGLFILMILAFVILMPPKGAAAHEWATTGPIFATLAPCLVIVGLVGQWFLRSHMHRQRDTRRVLGLHTLGTSDPVDWVEEDLGRMQKPETTFGTATFAAAVPKMLAAGCWTGAMWAARLTAALENEPTGEQLTDEVLQHPGTVEALAQFRRDPKCWSVAMGRQVLADQPSNQNPR
jgi:hypothetical protein